MKTKLLMQLLAVFICISCLISLSACKEKSQDQLPKYREEDYDCEVVVNALQRRMTFEEAVSLSDVAFLGEYVETITHEYYIEHVFTVRKCLYGNIPDNTVYLTADIGQGYVAEIEYEYDIGNTPYEAGSQYIIIANKYESVMFDHDRYVSVGDLLLNVSDNTYTMYSQNIDILESASFADYILSLPNSANDEAQISTATAEYESLAEEIAGESEFIAKLKIKELHFEALVHNGNTYVCEIEEIYKGDNINKRNDGSILVVILKNTVEVGESYVIGFNQVDEHSVIYEQAVTNGVFDMSDNELSEILEFIE